MTVAFGIDASYLPHLAAVIASIVRHAPGARFRFVVLHDGVPEERRARLETVAPEAEFFWAEIGASHFPAFTGWGHFTRAILYRLALEQLAPADCARVLYLDTDVIVLGDVREVWDVDLAGAPVAAVVDSFQDPAKFASTWGLPEAPQGYFNSGLLLIDLAQVREHALFSKAAAFVAEHHAALLFSDQDALNWTFWGRWKPLPLVWNVQRNNAIAGMSAELRPELRLEHVRPRMVHYTGPEKPWVVDGYHPWSWLYWRYLARTPFLREVTADYGVSRAARARMWLRWLWRQPLRDAARVAETAQV